MRSAVLVAALFCMNALTVDGSPHVRVHIMTEKKPKRVPLDGQCEWRNKALRCEPQLKCVINDGVNGYCKKAGGKQPLRYSNNAQDNDEVESEV